MDRNENAGSPIYRNINDDTTSSGLTEEEQQLIRDITHESMSGGPEAGWVLIREVINQNPHLFIIKMRSSVTDIHGEQGNNQPVPAWVCCVKLESK